ncbi:ATP-binding protein [Streptomyces sp. NPDC086783]|uniref:ATP-binding protein n=1 Tax=Streptomyces sp. NPDC086783 TaxID=3365758 RepID=UPI0038160F56
MPLDTGDGHAPTPHDVLLHSRFAGGDLPRLRVLVEGHATLAGLVEPRRDDFVVAMDAVATNAVQHGGGDGTLVLLRRGGELECRISDRGPGCTEAVLADLPHAPGASAEGAGLWLTRLVADRLSITPGAPGTTVSFAMRLL